jgi:type IV secretory pathway TrbD component
MTRLARDWIALGVALWLCAVLGLVLLAAEGGVSW